MSKSKRLIQLMMMVNRKRKFTVKELAQEFHVSQRTILRDLQELSLIGVPLYSEVGPHGGYQVLNESVLPPIAFTEVEAVSIFFASHALRHFSSHPFEKEYSSALNKFYSHMSSKVKNRIDQLRNRVDMVSPFRTSKSPYLSTLLEASILQKVVSIDYAAKGSTSPRDIQPIGIYANSGLWYCPAYCFLREDFRVFRCDRILSAAESPSTPPKDFSEIHLGNRHSYLSHNEKLVKLVVELKAEGVHRCETEVWISPNLYVRNDGTGWLEGNVPVSDLGFFAQFFIGLGRSAFVKEPAQLVEQIKYQLNQMLSLYE